MSITTLIFTLNEEAHLPPCLASLDWCDDVVVVDSFSDDATQEIAEAAQARFVQHAFTGFGDQRNWALDTLDLKYDWVLILDADECVPSELAEEMQRLVNSCPETVGAFRLKRRFHMWGRWLKYSSLYPTWVVRLIHKNKVNYVNRGHAETQDVDGLIEECEHDLMDQNVKGIDEWFERQNRYSTKDAEHELATTPTSMTGLFSLNTMHRRASLRLLAARVPGRPFIYFIYAYFFRRGFLDGWDGLIFCLMKATYQQMVSIKKYDIQRRKRA